MFQIRLADRQGRLTGPDISMVQAKCLEYLMLFEVLDEKKKREAERAYRIDHDTKMALIGSNPNHFMPIFYPQDPVEEALAEATNEDGTVDYSKVDVDKVPAAPAPQSEEESQHLKDWLESIHAGNLIGTVTAQELAEQGPDEGWV